MKRRKTYRIRDLNKETNQAMLFPAVFTSRKQAQETLDTFIKSPQLVLKYDIVER
jgi:hypothetical protein